MSKLNAISETNMGFELVMIGPGILHKLTAVLLLCICQVVSVYTADNSSVYGAAAERIAYYSRIFTGAH